MTDEEVYVLYALNFAAIDVNLQDLTNRALAADPALVGLIVSAHQTASLNRSRSRLRLFVNQSGAVTQLIADFGAADRKMQAALAKLKSGAQTIQLATSLVKQAVDAGDSLRKAGTKKPDS